MPSTLPSPSTFPCRSSSTLSIPSLSTLSPRRSALLRACLRRRRSFPSPSTLLFRLPPSTLPAFAVDAPPSTLFHSSPPPSTLLPWHPHPHPLHPRRSSTLDVPPLLSRVRDRFTPPRSSAPLPPSTLDALPPSSSTLFRVPPPPSSSALCATSPASTTIHSSSATNRLAPSALPPPI
uniref:uncharacterized protein n=1 Tax=Schizophyllum commune (strain H4-8 / FGSC 9210) TaxID=578458 RepID=UPI002160AD15|nr:uncharacterized protein SCHCODRAFT_02642501 [Schizophyllum commune H4-8]KAI5885774.1 hypothetical protein SCHCODRAFT_02642501 [Schizophyllum commune H4-8]